MQCVVWYEVLSAKYMMPLKLQSITHSSGVIYLLLKSNRLLFKNEVIMGPLHCKYIVNLLSDSRVAKQLQLYHQMMEY